MAMGSHSPGRQSPGAAMEGWGATVTRVTSTGPASTGSTPILPADVLVALGGVPVTTVASADAIAMGWPHGQALCASVLREGRLISPIWLRPAGGGSRTNYSLLRLRCGAGDGL